MTNWLRADELIKKTNAEQIALGKSLRLGHNHFSDWTKEEYESLLTLNRKFRKEDSPIPEPKLKANVGAPSSWDWRSEANSAGVCPVGAIQNQGNCGSCYSFSASGAMEGDYVLFASPTPTSFITISEQQIIDCSDKEGDHGCGGGWYSNVWDYSKNNPITTYSDYPYSSGYTDETTPCTASEWDGIGMSSAHFGAVTKDDSTALIDAIYTQPISVAVDASGYHWSYYSTGTMTPSECGTSLDHAIMAVGYNNDATPPYYIVKNSWGTTWGIDGYIHLEITPGVGTCGIQSGPPEYPTDTTWVTS